MNPVFKKYLQVLLGIKFIFILMYFFSPAVLPHVTRQVDTLSVTLRYWMRWSLESQPLYPLLPAYLGSGNGYSIQFMEFPLLNLILAPTFALGLEWGRVLNNFLFMAVSILLTYGAYLSWRGKKVAGILVNDAFWVMLLISSTGIYFYKQIPDYAAATLVLWALGLSIDEEKPHFLASGFLLAVGLLIKPPQIVVLGPLLLHHNRKYITKSILLWIIPAIVPCVLYYTWGSKVVKSLMDTESYFGTHIRNPIECIVAFFGSPKEILMMVLESFFGRYVAIPMLIYAFWIRKIHPLVVILSLQIAGYVILTGDHIFIHNYYLVGIGFTASLLFINFFTKASRALLVIAFLILTVTTLERGYYEVRVLFRDNIYKQCKTLKERNPEFPWGQNYVFQATNKNPPTAGLCFGERTGKSTSEFGFYFKKQEIPQFCKVVDETKEIVLVKCAIVGASF